MSNPAVVHVGTGINKLSVTAINDIIITHAINVCCHGFADLSTGRRSTVMLPEFVCLGHTWRLRVYLGGDATSDVLEA